MSGEIIVFCNKKFQQKAYHPYAGFREYNIKPTENTNEMMGLDDYYCGATSRPNSVWINLCDSCAKRNGLKW